MRGRPMRPSRSCSDTTGTGFVRKARLRGWERVRSWCLGLYRGPTIGSDLITREDVRWQPFHAGSRAQMGSMSPFDGFRVSHATRTVRPPPSLSESPTTPELERTSWVHGFIDTPTYSHGFRGTGLLACPARAARLGAWAGQEAYPTKNETALLKPCTKLTGIRLVRMWMPSWRVSL